MISFAYWSIGGLECCGIAEKLSDFLISLLHYSITPALHLLISQSGNAVFLDLPCLPLDLSP